MSLKVGSKIGNMTLEAISSVHATYRYVHPNHSFRFYLFLKEKELQLGYVEYLGGTLENMGTRIYVQLLLEGAARRLEEKDKQTESK